MVETTGSATVVHIGVGIDTARYGHRVTFLREDRQPAAPALTVTENPQGYQQLDDRLRHLSGKHPGAHFHVHLDAAGQYAANLERFLRSLPWPMTISVGEPKRNKDYHKAFFPKRTTDDTESHAMARFGVVEQPRPSVEIPDQFFALREVASRLQGQVRDTTRATNRLHNVLARVFPELATLVDNLACGWIITLLKKYPTPQRIAAARLSSLQQIRYLKPEVAQKLQTAARNTVGSFRGELAEALIRECVDQLAHCRESEKRLEKLLRMAYGALPPSGHIHVVSIPGIGVVTAAVLVAKMISIGRFATPEKLVGYFGVFPEESTSGVDRWGKKVPPGTMHMSAKGSDLVRSYLWNAAKSASQHNQAVRDLYARLRKKGTRGDVALGHCMRKLLHQVFGVWASNKPFDETLVRSRHAATETATETVTDKGEQAEPSADVQAQSEKMAAGHKRDVLPESKVVTAANINLTTQPGDWQASRGSIDYAWLRSQITLEQVLDRLGYADRLHGRGPERRGPCPFHAPSQEESKSFTINLRKHVFRCCHPNCGVKGNVLDLWALAHQLPLYEAALDLAKAFQLHTGKEKRQPVTPIHQ